jgi:hypothetical protein
MRALLQQSAVSGGSSGNKQQLEIQVMAMPDDTLVNRMVAQTAAQPGEPSCRSLNRCGVL